ncbi:hypothetical protein EKO27_g7967 [Xylaria grammica]|uniref:Uncharacterized protein n=1 Tax=Xylaria grammica TaxID=363999 RepID=A0A439CY53_9PEZI|nr:hypothetical protein EKO27_g7967 [Xylaria grammica]
MASNRSKGPIPEFKIPDMGPQNSAQEKEEDKFVLISRRNPWKDGKLVSSFGEKGADKDKKSKDQDGWETIPLNDSDASQSSKR